jgi:hypothetical protein
MLGHASAVRQPSPQTLSSLRFAHPKGCAGHLPRRAAPRGFRRASVCPPHAGAFSPGVPAAFLANYSAAVRFLEALEGHCVLRTSLQQFRDCAAVETFLGRWKLSVYFSLRFQVGEHGPGVSRSKRDPFQVWEHRPGVSRSKKDPFQLWEHGLGVSRSKKDPFHQTSWVRAPG